MWWKTTEDGICIHMDENKKTISSPLALARKTTQTEAWRQRSWPCKGVPLQKRGREEDCPELAFGVSLLAPHDTNKVGEIKVHRVTELDKLIHRAQEIKNHDGARLRVLKLNIEEIVALTHFDASFAQEAGLKSQCGMFTVLTDFQSTNRLEIRHLVHYESSTIQRVVRRTMAAESAALSKSLHRQLCVRLLVGSYSSEHRSCI